MSLRRLALGLLVGVIALLILSHFMLRPAYPFIADSFKELLSKKFIGDTWRLGEVTVTQEEAPGFAVTYYHFRDGEDALTVNLLRPEREEKGYAGFFNGPEGYLQFRDSEQKLAVDELPKEMAEQLRAAQALAEKALRKNIWPWPLWHLKPFVRRIADGRARLRVSGPYDGFLFPGKVYYGAEEVITCKIAKIAGGIHSMDLTMWDDRFVAELRYGKLTLVGSGDELVAHQRCGADPEAFQRQLAQLRALMEESATICETVLGMPEGLQPRLGRALEMLNQREVTLGEPLSSDEMDALLKPWWYTDGELTDEERTRASQEVTWQHEPTTIAEVVISFPEEDSRANLQLSRGDLSVRIRAPGASFTRVLIDRKDGRLPALEVLNHGAHPKLTASLAADEEALIAEVCSMAQDLLAAPVDAWPEGSRTESFTRLLAAIVHRQFVVRPDIRGAMLQTRSEAEGSEVELYLSSLAPKEWKGIDLKLSSDGFALYREIPDLFITCEGERIDAITTAPPETALLSTDELRQLRGFLKALDHTRDRLPEQVLPGLERYREFLEHPEALKPTFVESLSPPEWSTKARMERARRLNPTPVFKRVH